MAEFDFGIDNLDLINENFLNSSDIGTVVTTAKDVKKIEDEENDDDIKKDADKKDIVLPSNEEITNKLFGDADEDDDEDDKNAPPVKKDAPKNDNINDNEFEALSKELIKLGVFTEDEDEQGNVIAPRIVNNGEEFRDSFLHEVKKQSSITIQSFLSKFGEDRQELFNAIFVNGVDPTNYIPKFNELQDFSSLDITDEDNQEKVVRAYYKKANWSEESINKKITKLKDLAYLEEEAQEVHPKLVEDYKVDLKRQEQEIENNRLAQERSSVDFQRQVDTILRESLKTRQYQGFPISEKTYKDTLDYISVPKWKTKTGDLLTDLDKAILDTKNPENIKHRVLLGFLAKHNFDLSKVKSSAISNESNELFSSLKKEKSKQGVVSTKSSSWIDKL